MVEVISEGAAGSRQLVGGHPRLVEPLAVGETESGEYTVVWPRGETLAQRLTDFGPMPWHRAADMVAALAEAADFAHRQGTFHGGIDLACVQFGEDRLARLAGFGLARLRAGATGGALAADARFAAPEVGGTGEATQAGDVYSLGAVLVAALTGGALDTADIDAPGPIGAVVLRAMAADPEARFASAATLADALRAARDRSLYEDDDEDDDAVEPAGDEQEPVVTAAEPDPYAGFSFIDTAGSGTGPVDRNRRQQPEVTFRLVDTVPAANPGSGADHAVGFDHVSPSAPLPPPPVMAPAGTAPFDPAASGPVVVPDPLVDHDWYSADQNLDWSESVRAVVAEPVVGTRLDDQAIDLLPGLDENGRRIITLADAERGVRQGQPGRNGAERDLPELVPTNARPLPPAPAGSVITIADAEQAVLKTEAPSAPIAAPAAPVLTVDRGRLEVDRPVQGDVLVTGGQLVIHAEIHGSVTVDGGRVVVFAPVYGDVINGGGTVSIEARVHGRIRGHREFTTVRPGTQLA